MENHLAVTDVHSGPGSAIYVLGDFGPHIHPFCALGFPLLNEGPLTVLRANDSLTPHVPSTELLRAENSSQCVGFYSLCPVISSENKQQDQPQRTVRGHEEEGTRRTLLPRHQPWDQFYFLGVVLAQYTL